MRVAVGGIDRGAAARRLAACARPGRARRRAPARSRRRARSRSCRAAALRHPRDRPGVGPGPRLDVLAGRERLREGALEQDLRQQRLGVDPDALADQHARRRSAARTPSGIVMPMRRQRVVAEVSMKVAGIVARIGQLAGRSWRARTSGGVRPRARRRGQDRGECPLPYLPGGGARSCHCHVSHPPDAAGGAEDDEDQAGAAEQQPEPQPQLRIGRGLRQDHAVLRRRRRPTDFGAATACGWRRYCHRRIGVELRLPHRAVRRRGVPPAPAGERSPPNTLSKSQPAGRLSGMSARVRRAPSGRLGVWSTATRLVSRVTR